MIVTQKVAPIDKKAILDHWQRAIADLRAELDKLDRMTPEQRAAELRNAMIGMERP